MTKLSADPKRQANDALRGYVYQILRSLVVWLDLSDDEQLFLEGAEDLDRIDPATAITEQIKNTAASVTLRTRSVVDAINHYWEHAHRNPDRAIQFRYVTTSTIGVEQGSPFGSAGGLHVWNQLRASRESDKVPEFAAVLARIDALAPPIRKFLATATSGEILNRLIEPIEWAAGQEDDTALVREIKDQLVLHGERSGIGPADSEQAFGALYQAAFEAAKAKDDRVLSRAEFLRIFADATAIQIPKQDIRALVQAAMSHSAPTLVSTPAIIFEGAPPLPPHYFRRIGLEQKIRDSASAGAVLVYGSTGSGKTLAIASSFASEPTIWLSLRELDIVEVKARLSLARDMLRVSGEPRLLVIDDIDALSDSRLLESALAALWNAQVSLGGRLIVTSDRQLPARLAQAIGLAPTRELQMQPFDAEEIKLFLLEAGASEGRATNWGKLLEVSTYGHPQLVAVRIATIAAQGFPAPKADDLLQSAEDVDRIRFEARRLISALPSDPRELLYRASLLSGRLNRQRLMAIARLEAPIPEPGSAIDVIAGPWLEQTDGHDYRVSPLVRGSAEHARGQDWAKGMHAKIAWVYLVERTLSPWDISAICLHCLVGGTAGPLAHVLQVVFSADEEAWNAIGEACVMYSTVALGEADKLPFKRIAEVLVFRIFQYRIAAETNPETALRVGAKLEQEYREQADHEMMGLFRLIYLAQVLMRTAVPYPIELIIQYSIELTKLSEEMQRTYPERAAGVGMEVSKPITFGATAQLVGFRLMKMEAIDEFLAFLEALKLHPKSESEKILQAFADPEGLATILIDRFWLERLRSNEPNWAEFRTNLRRAFDDVLELGGNPMAQAIAAVLLRVIDENLNDPQAALAEAEILSPVAGNDAVYRCALAKVLAHVGDYPKAREIWVDALPLWPASESIIGRAFAYRVAGIAAGKAAAWQDAACFFEAAQTAATESDHATFKLGLEIDEAFSRYVAGDRAVAIAAFGRALSAIEAFQDRLESEPYLSLQRRFGGLLSALENWGKERQPEIDPGTLAGLCSNVDPFETDAIVAPPIEMLRLNLVQLELRHGASLDIAKREVPKLRASPYITFHALAGTVCFELALRTREFGHVMADGLRQLDGMADIADLSARGDRDPFRLDSGKRMQWAPSSEELLAGQILASTFSLAAADELDRLPLEQWREDAHSHPQAARLLALVNHLEGLFVTGGTPAWATVVNCPSGRWEWQVASALAATLLEPIGPENMLRCHGLWAGALSQPILRDLVDDSIADLVSRQWGWLIEAPALFATPQVSMPLLREAIESNERGWAKTRLVLNAAASGVSLPQADPARASIEAIEV